MTKTYFIYQENYSNHQAMSPLFPLVQQKTGSRFYNEAVISLDELCKHNVPLNPYNFNIREVYCTQEE